MSKTAFIVQASRDSGEEVILGAYDTRDGAVAHANYIDGADNDWRAEVMFIPLRSDFAQDRADGLRILRDLGKHGGLQK